MSDALERNARVQARYDELAAIGKHGHYETMFQVVREELELSRRALPAPSGEMREILAEEFAREEPDMPDVVEEIRTGKGASDTASYFTIECAIRAMQRVAALRPSASPQGDRNEQIMAMIARFDEKVKTWTPQQALDYLVELGTHDADGNLTPEYGGPERIKAQGEE